MNFKPSHVAGNLVLDTGETVFIEINECQKQGTISDQGAIDLATKKSVNVTYNFNTKAWSQSVTNYPQLADGQDLTDKIKEAITDLKLEIEV